MKKTAILLVLMILLSVLLTTTVFAEENPHESIELLNQLEEPKKELEAFYVTSDNEDYNNAFYYNGNLYKLFTVSMRVYIGDKNELNTLILNKCTEVGGHLATITSAEENSAVFLYVKNNFYVEQGWSRSCMLGGVYDKHDRAWKWVTGEPFEYSNWETAPSSDYPYLCYSISNDYGYSERDQSKWSSRKDYTTQEKYFHDLTPYRIFYSTFLCEWDNACVQKDGTIGEHQFDEATVIKQATSCSSNGEARKTCQVCGGTAAEILTIPHQYATENAGIFSSLSIREQHCTECDAVRYIHSNDVWSVAWVICIGLGVAIIAFVIFAAIPSKKRFDQEFPLKEQ